MSLSEVRDRRTCQKDCHIPQLSAELRRLGVSVAALSEVRRPETGGSVELGIPAWYRDLSTRGHV